MNFLPILLFFIYASASASASAKVFGDLKNTEANCIKSNCENAYYTLSSTCGVDTVEDNYPCACKLSLAFFNDLVVCAKSCGVIGDESYNTPENVQSFVCSMGGVSTGSSSSSSTTTTTTTSSSSSSSTIPISTTTNGGNDILTGSPSNSFISVIGLVVSLLI